MAQIGMVDLIGPIQAGWQMAQQARANALQREQIRLQAERIVQEMQEARMLQEYRTRALKLQEEQEKRLAQKWAQEQAREKRFMERFNMFKSEALQRNMQPADLAYAGVPSEYTDLDAAQEAYQRAALETGYGVPQATQMMGQDESTMRAIMRDAARWNLEQSKIQSREGIAEATREATSGRSETTTGLTAENAKRNASTALMGNARARIDALQRKRAAIIASPYYDEDKPDPKYVTMLDAIDKKIEDLEREEEKARNVIESFLFGESGGGVQPATAETVQPSAGFEIEGYRVVPRQ